MKISIIVIIIVIILVLSFFIYFILRKNKYNQEYLIKGGEAFGITRISNDNNERKIIYQYSQDVLDETFHRFNSKGEMFYNKRDLNNFLGLAVGKMRNHCIIPFNNERYLIRNMIYPKFFSDALLDGINIMVKNENIEYVITQNEFPSNVYFNDNYIDNIRSRIANKDQSNKLSILKSCRKDFYSEFTDFELQEMKDKHINPYHNHNLFEYDAIKLIDNGDEIFVGDLKHKFIFLEYSYKGFEDDLKYLILRYFEEIHRHTESFINQIINDSNSNDIILARFVFNNTLPEDITIHKPGIEKLSAPDIVIKTELSGFNFDKNLIKSSTNGHISHNIREENIFKQINIPSTVNSFEMDEFLLIKSRNVIYHIQIEHSEGLSDHKSNIVEFLLRTYKLLWKDEKDDELKDLLIELGYDFEFDTNKDKNQFVHRVIKQNGREIIYKNSVFNCANESFCSKYLDIFSDKNELNRKSIITKQQFF